MGKSDGKVTLSTKLDTSGLKNAGKDIKSALASTTKAVVVFGAAVATAIGAAIKQSVDAYADYEQLVGGVETLFKGSADKVKKYAEEAYETAGVSANQYMETVTSFSASLISSLGGDTDKAADIANMALIDMSDNANKMGSDLESVQTAYQGFAKQQYQLLDNLKLGYGGTKTEMERLLADAEAFSGVKYDINNLGDVYEAIHQIQTKLDITGTTAKEAATTIAGSGKMAKSAWQNVLAAITGGGALDVAISNFVDSFQAYFENIKPAVERALVGVGQLIEKIGPQLVSTLSTAIIKAIPSLLVAVHQMVIGLVAGVINGVKELFISGAKGVLEEQAETVSNAVDNQKDLTKEVKKTAAEAKKAFAGFDQLNVLSGGADDGSGISQVADAVVASASVATPSGGGSSITATIEADLAAIMTVIGGALCAVGVVLLFSGNIPLGIGFLAAGVAEFSVAIAAAPGDTVSPTTTSTLLTIMGVIAGALVAIGVILIMVGSVGLGIGFLVAGAATLGVAIYAISEFSTAPVEDTLLTIEAIAGGAMLALGILLLYFGANKPLAIGLIIAGAAILAVAIAQIVAGKVSDEVAAWIYGITAIVSTALLVIGIIMLCTGHITPLSIGLVVAGAAGLATTIAINWNAITDSMQGPIGEIVAIASGALLVLGLILICCGVITPLTIGLLIAGAAGLATTVAFNWEAIVEWVKGAWEAVKQFWNKHIAPVFTAKFWSDLAKKCANGLIAGFEAAVNGIIGAFEKMINWIVGGINKLSFDVPDWVPGIGGKKFGFNIPEVKFERVSIPRLAQGAVIPPNREFLAVLGDQKRGTNIEAPLDTIKQALEEVMAQGSAGETVVTINFSGDLSQLARILKPAIETETRRKGGSLATGGIY